MPSCRIQQQGCCARHEIEIRFENRNAEDVHQEALAASYAEHQRVYETAVRAAKLEEARREHLKLEQRRRQEEERVRIEEARIREETRLREIEARARQIPPPPPPPLQQPTLPAASQPQQAASKPSAEQQPVTQAPTINTSQLTKPVVTPPINPFAQTPAQSLNGFQTTSSPVNQPVNAFAATSSTQPPSAASNLFATAAPVQYQPASKPFAQIPSKPANPFASTAPIQRQWTPQPSVQNGQTFASQRHPYLHNGVDRYLHIHRKLKELRKYVNNAADSDKQLKKTAGDLRRTLRVAVGQCVKDKSKNKDPLAKINHILQQALTTVASPGIDPSDFMLLPPQACEGAALEGVVHNGGELPMLFIYLLNFFAKYVVAQFISEAGVDPEIADPIGVVAVQVFSRADHQWRGQSMIDILIAKMRVVCPVLFGIRGNEKTEHGRASLGWIRDESGSYIPEDMHGSRMTGLAAGYAAICLRDFTRSKLKNPWPPTNYWQTLGAILATPPSERSVTQYLVLRSLIDGYEPTFLKFYGNTARAALQLALVKFPAGADAPNSAVPPGSSAVGGVKVLADKLARDLGIELRV